jgi:hypothetical protein
MWVSKKCYFFLYPSNALLEMKGSCYGYREICIREVLGFSLGQDISCPEVFVIGTTRSRDSTQRPGLFFCRETQHRDLDCFSAIGAQHRDLDCFSAVRLNTETWIAFRPLGLNTATWIVFRSWDPTQTWIHFAVGAQRTDPDCFRSRDSTQQPGLFFGRGTQHRTGLFFGHGTQHSNPDCFSVVGPNTDLDFRSWDPTQQPGLFFGHVTEHRPGLFFGRETQYRDLDCFSVVGLNTETWIVFRPLGLNIDTWIVFQTWDRTQTWLHFAQGRDQWRSLVNTAIDQESFQIHRRRIIS